MQVNNIAMVFKTYYIFVFSENKNIETFYF